MYIVLGSFALKHHLDNLGIKHNLNPSDMDILAYSYNGAMSLRKSIKQASNTFEIIGESHNKKFNTVTESIRADGNIIEITWPIDDNEVSTSTDLFIWMCAHNESLDSIQLYDRHLIIPSLDMLYTLKMSHRFLKNSPHFAKTMMHIKQMRKLKAKIFNKKWLALREKETYDYSHPKLNVKKDEFFKDESYNMYEHDDLHEAVKIMERPAYTYYMTYNQEVSCSKEAFDKCIEAIKLFGVLEESLVLALERSQIPTNFEVYPKRSFMIALEKVCTSITSGWFREYAWENFNIVVHLYEELEKQKGQTFYIDAFKSALAEGNIRLYGEE